MQVPDGNIASASRSGLVWILVGLAVTPAVLAAGTWVAPLLHLGPGVQDLSTFLGAVVTIVGSLVVLARGRAPVLGWLVLGIAAAAGLGVLALVGVHSAAVVVMVGTLLIALGHTVGHAVGTRIEDPGHLLPACVVAACVDLASIIHPQGPTHAIVESERAMDLLTVSFPVLGTKAFAPSVGVGDIVFAALLLGTAVRHRLPTARMAAAIVAGLLLAGLASALVQRAVPALPAIGACVVVGVSQARHLRKRDRKPAALFMAGAAALAVGVVISRLLS